MCSTFDPSPHRTAFTLIELLAVVAIVALIAALLFPVLAKTRERSDAAGCLASLRNIGLGISLYMNEHDGRLPGPINRGQSAKYGLGPNSLLYHIGSYMGLGERPAKAEDAYIVDAAICPAMKRATKGGDTTCWWLNQEAVIEGTTKRVNPWGHPASDPPGAPIKKLILARQSEQMVMQDADQALGAAWTGIPESPVHGDVRHRLYFDWHVAPAPAALGKHVLPDK